MLGNFPPFTTMQELNLDWILTKIKNILRFVPDDGAVGQILRRTPSGAEWSDEQGAGGSVTSVNGMQGAVVLGAADVGALPDTTVIPDSTSDLVNDSGFITSAQAPVQSVNGHTGTVSLGYADVGALPDTYVAPVTSVNGQTGAVSLTIPDSTSDLINDAGFVNAAGASAAAPVQSVNGQTGAVTIISPSKYIVETGTANGWDYDLYNDDTVIATQMMSATMTNYTTFGGFAGYYFSNVSTPFTMESGYYVGCDWSIGAGFALPAGRLSVTADSFNAYALSTQSGSTSVILRMTLMGKKAV